MTRLQTFLSDFNILTSPVSVTFQTGSRSPKPDHFLPLSMQVWSESTNQFSRQSADKVYFYNWSPMATKKIQPWLPKPYHILAYPKLTIHLVWCKSIHLFFKRQGAEELFLVQIWHSKCICDLEKKGQGHQNLITSYPFLDDLWSIYSSLVRYPQIYFPDRVKTRLNFTITTMSCLWTYYALTIGSYYSNPMEYRGMNIAHPLCAGYKNRLLIYTYAQCDYANHDLALNWYM